LISRKDQIGNRRRHRGDVEDREAFLAACRSVGLAVNIVPRTESKLCFVRDFDGNLFEIK